MKTSSYRPWHLVGGLVALLLLVLVGCITEPITGRRQLTLISPAQELQLGLSSFEQMKKEVLINRAPAINAMVQNVGKRIAAVAAPDLPNAQWEFVVFESKEANAFCLPAGKVGVYTGILPVTRDEAGLATVLAHEIAHATAHHGAERLSAAMAIQGIGQVFSASLANADPRTQALANNAYGLGTTLGIALPHDRRQESAADQIGLVYMARAGYNPAAAIAFWERFADLNRRSGGATPWFLSTHPLDEVRIQQLKSWLPRAQQEYRPQR